MHYNKKAIVLVNVGSPDKPDLKSVRRYLREFLNDPLVIDLPYILRKILVNLIIIPFRASRSTKRYKELWTLNGPPLKYYQESVRIKLSGLLKDKYDVYSAMRYGNPNLKNVLREIESNGYEEITLLPLYPQYAESTTGSAYKLFVNEVENWKLVPKISYIKQFYYNPVFIKSFAYTAKNYDLGNYDHIIFSFHGLPERQIQKIHPDIALEKCICEERLPDHGKFCYKATCYETARLLASELNIAKNNYSISFQSRMSDKWLSPFTNKVLKDKAGMGIKRILVIAPSFVADCLETIIEIRKEYSELFKKNGGEILDLLDSLNNSDYWIIGLSEIIKNTDEKS